MQFLPATWKRYGGGGDIHATSDAILAAARLLRANGAPADMAGALYAYNPSRRYVRTVSAYAGHSAPTRGRSPATTAGRSSTATPCCPRATRPGGLLQPLADRPLARPG